MIRTALDFIEEIARHHKDNFVESVMVRADGNIFAGVSISLPIALKARVLHQFAVPTTGKGILRSFAHTCSLTILVTKP